MRGMDLAGRMNKREKGKGEKLQKPLETPWELLLFEPADPRTR